MLKCGLCIYGTKAWMWICRANKVPRQQLVYIVQSWLINKWTLRSDLISGTDIRSTPEIYDTRRFISTNRPRIRSDFSDTSKHFPHQKDLNFARRNLHSFKPTWAPLSMSSFTSPVWLTFTASISGVHSATFSPPFVIWIKSTPNYYRRHNKSAGR